MAFQPGFAQLHLEVRPAPGAFLTLSPESLVVDQGDPVEVILTVSPLNGYAGPIWVHAVNYASSEPIFSVNPVPAGGGQTTARLNFGQPGIYDIGFQADDVPEP